jgi:hypothetical protein
MGWKFTGIYATGLPAFHPVLSFIFAPPASRN